MQSFPIHGVAIPCRFFSTHRFEHVEDELLMAFLSSCSICSPSAVVCLRKCLCSTCLTFDDRAWFDSRTCTIMCHYWSEAYYNAHSDAKTCMTISLDLSEAYYSVWPNTKIYTTWCHDWWKVHRRAGVALNLLKDVWFSSLHGESMAWGAG